MIKVKSFLIKKELFVCEDNVEQSQIDEACFNKY